MNAKNCRRSVVRLTHITKKRHMELHIPFQTPVAVFDATQHLSFLRSMFSKKTDKFKYAKNGTGLRTTLGPYSFANEPTCDLDDSLESVAIRKFIESAALDFANLLGCADGKYTPVVKTFWLNEMMEGSSQTPHAHYGHHFSGCFYIDMPEGSAGINMFSPLNRFDRDFLEITRPNTYSSPVCSLEPGEGQMYIWESWIPHGVSASKFTGVRRSAAFDVVLQYVQERT